MTQHSLEKLEKYLLFFFFRGIYDESISRKRSFRALDPEGGREEDLFLCVA
ncbi:hypothetical protein EGR_08350 [Echinococcus granulosus]|uniref:Uncharacterized protein n=1 Tax=Echinococcus granulosus TaxID=6210 RepID=W6UF41_ECHGR|nr:hypothetical protein EGR_08350 [Echinococcus granulosus]EUB56772.1 hypothetical protein EGR_08350 [Echinococcus granulosus]